MLRRKLRSEIWCTSICRCRRGGRFIHKIRQRRVKIICVVTPLRRNAILRGERAALRNFFADKLDYGRKLSYNQIKREFTKSFMFSQIIFKETANADQWFQTGDAVQCCPNSILGTRSDWSSEQFSQVSADFSVQIW